MVADAVRMSLSIPFHFEPFTLRNPLTGAVSTVVDGGVLSDVAIEIFDRTDGREPRWPASGGRQAVTNPTAPPGSTSEVSRSGAPR
jgi:NTE family protein